MTADVMRADLIARAQKVRLVAFDVDGIMTDGTLFLADDGQEFKGFNSLDGHGLKMLKASGVKLAIITGRSVERSMTSPRYSSRLIRSPCSTSTRCTIWPMSASRWMICWRSLANARAMVTARR